MILQKYKKASLMLETAVVLPVYSAALLVMLSVMTIQLKVMDIQEEMFIKAEEEAVLCTDGPEYIRLDEKKDLLPLTDLFGLIAVPVERKVLVHAWCGYENCYFPDDEYVFITEDSEVYHRDRLCSHIRLSVREVTADELPALRNESGGRYRSCGICHSRLSDKNLYITDDGDRYHNSVTCSGLKRTVRAVRLSEVRDRRPCSRCGR